MCNTRFFICRHCGNFVGSIHSSGVPMICCGEPMTELLPNTVEASAEKHLPVVTADGDLLKVSVGSAQHPMLEEHNIGWVLLETENGCERRCLKSNEAPEAVFHTGGDKPVAAYAWCNLHGLWKTEL